MGAVVSARTGQGEGGEASRALSLGGDAVLSRWWWCAGGGVLVRDSGFEACSSVNRLEARRNCHFFLGRLQITSTVDGVYGDVISVGMSSSRTLASSVRCSYGIVVTCIARRYVGQLLRTREAFRGAPLLDCGTAPICELCSR